MNFFRKNYNTLVSLKNSYLNSLVINKFDKTKIFGNKEVFNNEIDGLNNFGYYVFNNALPKKVQSLLFGLSQEKKLFSQKIIIFFDFFYKNYFSLVQNYLGNDACLILLGLSEQKKDTASISGNWHTDNWGRSLNVFVSIDSNGLVPTAFIEKSHKKKYFVDINEYLRQVGFKNTVEKKNTILIKHNSNDISFFDGNGLHRGIYEKDSFRLALNMTFVSYEKICNLGLKKIPSFFFLKNSKPKVRKVLNEHCILHDNLKSEDFLKYPFFKKEFFISKNNHEYFCF